MNQSPSISAVIFDMDGLMIDSERIAQQAWRQASAEWDYVIADTTYLQVVGRTIADTQQLFLQTFGPDFPFQAMYERKQQLMYATIDRDGLPTKPGLFELLTLIDQLGLEKGIATSTARPRAVEKLAKAQLLSHFSVIVCGDEIDHGKPAPDIFLAAAEGLQCTPETCLVLEDSEAGIRGAYNAGMTPIMIPDLKQPSAETQAIAYRVLKSLHEVTPLLTRLNKE